MRTLFLFLLLANAAFFAWSQHFSPADGGSDPSPLARQIEPEKLRVVAPAEAPPAGAAKSTPAVAVATTSSATALSTASGGACLEWGSFTVADAPRAEKALEPLGLGERVAQRRTEESAGWWVFIAPQGNRPGALKKAAELKALGIEEFFIVTDEGQYRWAVSLGVFRNEESAQARLNALRERGVRSAQIGPRETMVPKVWLQVKAVDAPLEARLKDIARQVEGSELRACPAA